MSTEKISFVIPCYRSEKTVTKVVDEIHSVMKDNMEYDYEILLINDDSPDRVWDVIMELANSDKRIKGINLTKNFGQASALMAGFNCVSGDIVISLDDDYQTPACEVIKLIDKLHEGYDVVFAKYNKFRESFFRRIGSKINSIMTHVMIGKPKGIYIQSFFAAKRFVINEMIQYTHSYPYIYGLVFRTTCKVTNVEVEHRAREEGSSGYTLIKLIRLWLNGFTAFSVKPLRVATILGGVFALFGFVLGSFFFINKLLHPDIPYGYSSVICSITFFSGLIMMLLGVIGEYIGRIYICINKSPQFIIREIVNMTSFKKEGHEDERHNLSGR